jgi:transcriptional regulator with XRE-family HTH domain
VGGKNISFIKFIFSINYSMNPYGHNELLFALLIILIELVICIILETILIVKIVFYFFQLFFTMGDIMNIYERIKEICDEQNITISYLESQIGISNGSVSKWKSQTPKADNLYSVSKYLNRTIEYFLTGEDGSFVRGKSLTKDEEQILAYYNELGEEDKIIIKAKMIKFLREQRKRDAETNEEAMM